MDIFGLIENMSGYKCPHCGEHIDLFGIGGGEKTAADAGILFLGKIPFDQNVVTCGDSGCAFQTTYKDSPVTLAFNKIADRMAELG